MNSILMAYATKHGSTREVAEAVAAALREAGAKVDVRLAGRVRGLAGYDMVVLGAPLYSGRWHRDAGRFLRRNRKQLSGVPVAVFGMGPRTPDADAWSRSRAQLDRALSKRDWLEPASVAVFGGVDPPKRQGESRRDLRDWDAIRAWAGQLNGMANHRHVQRP
ncbi:MAG: flavodoxin domain-containing protein [Micromonosporaceae bacterium]